MAIRQAKSLQDSFLYQHYRSNMDAGVSHAEYIVVNDIDDDLSKRLKDAYAAEKKAGL